HGKAWVLIHRKPQHNQSLMNPRLEELRRELASPLPHPDRVALRAMSHQTVEWILQHFATLAEQPVGQTAGRAEMESLLRGPPPEHGEDFSQVLDQFQHKVA